ncbi:orotate phosphoribosyltransferase [Nitrospinae bacterium AH-259-F20]|nr:orotate phosphoribosyltransferase [Nitrospinae bacterium AH-259-F20]
MERSKAPEPRLERLTALFREKSFKRGSFTLSSGITSRFYFDAKPTLFTAEGSRLVGELLCDEAARVRAAAVGGPMVGAVPVVHAALAVAAERGLALKGFWVRKEPKGHGTERLLEGEVDPSDRVLIVDDVITTGSSIHRTVEALAEAGCTEVAGVCVLLDRRQRSAEEHAALEALGLVSLMDLASFLDSEEIAALEAEAEQGPAS